MTGRLLPVLPLAVSLAGCFRSVSWLECDDSAMAVSDTDFTPGGTAQDLLAAATGSRSVQGTVLDEQLVGVTWTVERGVGTAEWIESSTVSHTEQSGLGFGHSMTLADPDCHDRVEVPIDASVVTDDGSVDVAVSTVVESRPDLGGFVPRVSGSGSYADATFPPVPGVDPADFEDKGSFVVLEGLDTTVSGRAGWEGSESESSSSAHYIVEFPLPDL